jgi:hypothetical protein
MIHIIHMHNNLVVYIFTSVKSHTEAQIVNFGRNDPNRSWPTLASLISAQWYLQISDAKIMNVRVDSKLGQKWYEILNLYMYGLWVLTIIVGDHPPHHCWWSSLLRTPEVSFVVHWHMWCTLVKTRGSHGRMGSYEPNFITYLFPYEQGILGQIRIGS